MHLSSPVAKATVRSKAVVQLLLIHFYCCSHCLTGSVFSSCFVMQYLVSYLFLQSP